MRIIKRIELIIFNIIDFLKITEIKKRIGKIRDLRVYDKDVRNQLKTHLFKSIKRVSLSTWKFYGTDKIRVTYTAKKGKKKFLIKCTKGFDEKTNNSIRFQLLFNDIFTFIPKGFELKMNGYHCLVTEFINSYPFSFAKYLINKKNADCFIRQLINILDAFYKYDLTHCDINSVNILIDKKSLKLYVIDFDTCCSGKYGLMCHDFPRSRYSVVDAVSVTFDDARAMCGLLSDLNVSILLNNHLFDQIKERTGRQTITIEKRYCNY